MVWLLIPRGWKFMVLIPLADEKPVLGCNRGIVSR
jgi:hypothetical protein